MEPFDTLRHRFRRAVTTAEEGYRLFLLRMVIMPVSRIATRAVTLKVAEVCSAGILMFDLAFRGNRLCKTFRAIFNLSGLRAFFLAWKYCSLPFTDFASNLRYISGADRLDDLEVEEVNGAEIGEMRRKKGSVIIATGHFTRKASVALALRRLTPGTSILTTLPANPGTGNRIYDNRIELQFGANLRAASVQRPDLILANVGTEQNMVRTLCKKLRESETAVLVSIDAPWDDSHNKAHERAFAGFENKRFSVGVLTLARLSGCPIVPLVCHVDASGRAILEWGESVRITKNDTEEMQVKALDKMLDQLETAIGSRPEQYLLSIGDSRKWNTATKEWESAAFIS